MGQEAVERCECIGLFVGPVRNLYVTCTLPLRNLYVSPLTFFQHGFVAFPHPYLERERKEIEMSTITTKDHPDVLHRRNLPNPPLAA